MMLTGLLQRTNANRGRPHKSRLPAPGRVVSLAIDPFDDSRGVRSGERASACHSGASKSQVYGGNMSGNSDAVFSNEKSSALGQLSDAELLTHTRSLVGRSNRLLAELLAHLGEVEARGIHRMRACSSLYTYCIYELRFSEDEAFRRVAASRLVRRFPALLDAIGAGELHLTGLLMLGPHLSEANLAEVMVRAKHRTKREIARLVRVLDPLPAVPARIEPLGPAPARLVPPEPTWEQFVDALSPVRELDPRERPRDWGLAHDVETSGLRPEEQELGPTEQELGPTHLETTESEGSEAPAPARVAAGTLGQLAEPERFKVQFTASEEYVRLVEEAKALLSHAAPRVTLDDVHLRAMRAFVEALRKRKYGSKEPSNRVGLASDSSGSADEGGVNEQPRGRYIPRGIRRAVAERDGHRCAYVDASGRRCSETRRLEFHHVVPFALSPSHDPSNLTLRCAAHNALAAEEDFGRQLIQEWKNANRHGRLSEQESDGSAPSAFQG